MNECTKNKLLDRLYMAWFYKEDESSSVEFAEYGRGYLEGIVFCLKQMGYEVGFNPLAKDGENPFTLYEKGE